MKFYQLISEMITTASLGNWSQNPNGIGFDMPLEAARRIKKKSVMQGLNRRQYAKMIGTTENFYNKELKKVFSEQKNSVYRHEIIPIIDFINKYIKRKIC